MPEVAMATHRAQVPNPNGDPGISGHVATLEFSRVDLNKGTAVFVLRPADGTAAPEIPVPLSQIRPNTLEDREDLWKSLVKSILDSFRDGGRYPEFVKGHEVWTDADSTGEPALYVRILVGPSKGPASNAQVDKWNQFLSQVQDTLIRLRLQRWPYVQLGEQRRKR
jgi:hypothetical protein